MTEDEFLKIANEIIEKQSVEVANIFIDNIEKAMKHTPGISVEDAYRKATILWMARIAVCVGHLESFISKMENKH